MPRFDKKAEMPVIKPSVVIPRERVGQAGLLPQAIKNRNLGQVILLSNTGTSSAVLNNGDQVLFDATLTAANDARVLAVHDVSLYVGSVAVGNELPGGASVDESQWDVYYQGNDWGSTDDNNVVNRTYVRNISAGASTTVLYRSQARVIVNTQQNTPS